MNNVFGNVYQYAPEPGGGGGYELLSPLDVRNGVDRGDGVFGILVSPTPATVKSGTLYGANSEYVGAFTCGESDPGDVEWVG